MPFFGVPIRNGLPIGLGSVAGFGVQQFDPSQLFEGGTVAGAWYDPSDLTTLFTTSAGTTQCAMPGLGSAVSVGLMLDKSQGLVLGSELVTAPYSGAVSGGFSITSTSVVRDGVTAGGTASLTLSTTLTANALHQVTFTAAGLSGDNTIIRVGSTVSGNFYRITTAGTYTIYLPAGGTAAILGIAPFVGSAGGITLTNISVKALPGNHAIAFNDTTARPELRARVNLVTYSEEFNNAAWAKSGLNAFGSGSVANTTATLDPLGGNTADYIQENTATASHLVLQAASVGANVQAVFSVYMKAAERTWGVIYPETSGGAGAGVWFNLATGVVGTQGAGRVGSITSVGNGWYLCSVVATLSTDSQRFYLGPASADNTISYTGTGTSGIYIWGADLRHANIGANVPAYQRIADANTYDTSGFPLYLRFDGIDDSMYTPANLNLSGTDKVSVFAGVRRNATATAFPVEFSAQSDANNGTFGIGNDSGGAEYFFNSRGTTLRQVSIDNAAYNAPVSNVVTLSADIAAPSLVARLNGTQVGSNTSSQGAGNFGTYPLYIGSRANSSFFLNGHLHSLIIAGNAVSAGNISATEQWVAGKTGIVI